VVNFTLQPSNYRLSILLSVLKRSSKNCGKTTLQWKQMLLRNLHMWVHVWVLCH